MTLKIERGRVSLPARRLIYGPQGVGKSKFACKAEIGCKGVLVMNYEEGVEYFGAPRVTPPRTWDASLAMLRELCTGAGDWDTVVIDTVDKLEAIGASEICAKGKKASLADFGYGDGYYAMGAKWREVLHVLESARAAGRSVTLIGHVTTATIKDPTMAKDYHKLVAALTKNSWLETHKWVDHTLFADYERGQADGRVVPTGKRILHTVSGMGFDAKHRPNIPSPLPLSWVAYEREVKRFERTAQQVRVAIEPLRPNAKDQDKLSAALALAGEDVEKLVSIERTLESRETAVVSSGNGETKVEQAT